MNKPVVAAVAVDEEVRIYCDVDALIDSEERLVEDLERNNVWFILSIIFKLFSSFFFYLGAYGSVASSDRAAFAFRGLAIQAEWVVVETSFGAYLKNGVKYKSIKSHILKSILKRFKTFRTYPLVVVEVLAFYASWAAWVVLELTKYLVWQLDSLFLIQHLEYHQ